MVKLDFPEKLIQTGKKENTDALLKRLKVSPGHSSQLLESLEAKLLSAALVRMKTRW